MKVFACAIAALLVAASAALPAAAQTPPKQPKTYVKKDPTPQATPPPRDSGFREQRADKLPYGSQAW